MIPQGGGLLERILTEHVVGGKPVEELAFARNPLAAGGSGHAE